MHVHVFLKKMKSNINVNTGNTSVSVRSIMQDGIFLSVLGNDYYLSYDRLPWFKNAKTSDIFNVAMYGKDSIRWDALDIDLGIDSLKSPEKYPLVMKRYAEETI